MFCQHMQAHLQILLIMKKGYKQVNEKELGMKVKSKGTWMPSPQQESSIPRQRVTESFEKVVK